MKITKRYIFMLFMLPALAQSAWQLVGSNDTYNYYVDTNSVHRHGNIVEYKAKEVHHESRLYSDDENPNQPEKPYDTEIISTRFNCANNKVEEGDEVYLYKGKKQAVDTSTYGRHFLEMIDTAEQVIAGKRLCK